VLATPLEVLVTDTRGRPVAGANVVFTFADGVSGGEATPASASTNEEGKAATTLKLGTRAGTISGTAEVPVEEGVTPVRASFTLTALAADAAGIALVSGNPQTGTVNSVLPEPLVVVVTDASGNPIPNVPIQWTVTGGGSVSATETLTGADGRASVTRTLGPTAGLQSTEASSQVSLAGSPVAFTHTATAGGASGVVIVSGDNQSAQAGTALANPLVVQVLDAQGNPIPGRAVTWVVAEGAVNPETSTTDAQGHASTIWTVGSTPGPKTANAVVSGVGTATFNATATAGSVSAANSSVSASPSTVSVGGTSTITVTVRDGSNNPVSDAAVSVTASGSGNTITPATVSSGSNGVATFTFSSTVAETKTIIATAGGVTLSDQTTITVQKTGSTVEINEDEPDPSIVGQAITVEFSVRGSGGTPTGEVIVTLSGGDETCSATLADGNGACSLTPTAAGPDGNNNRRIITATYGGDARFSGDTDTENHRVNPVPPANNPPTAAFTPPTCTVGQPCPFDDTSTDSDGNIVSRSWTFQDGVPATSSDDNPQITFASEGSKSVTLTVTDDDGATNSVTHSVTVNPATPTNQPPEAAFETHCDETGLCDFTDNSTDFDGNVVAWSWNFGHPDSGDANLSDQPNPSHPFSVPGVYVVTLTVTDDEGAEDSHTTTLTFF
jgi:PKD repeat protein